MNLLRYLVLSAATASTALTQTYTIGTAAGGLVPTGIPATSAFLSNVAGVAVDPTSGDVYFTTQHSLMRIERSTGVLIRVAGDGRAGGEGDGGPAIFARLRSPGAVAVGVDGSVYVADSGNHRVRKVAEGVISTVAGIGARGFSGDGREARGAHLNGPGSLAVGTDGSLYVADTGNYRIRKVTGGVITTVAGTGVPGSSGEGGEASGAQLSMVSGVAVDAGGDLYLSEWGIGDARVRKVAGGVITTVAGGGSSSGEGVAATSARLNPLQGVTVDARGDIYFAENGRIRRVANGVISTVAGTSGPVTVMPNENGPAMGALMFPRAVAVDPAGDVYVADDRAGRIRKIANGVIATVAGGGATVGDNRTATRAQVNPSGVAVNRAGELYIADAMERRVRKVSDYRISTVAGGLAPVPGLLFSGDNGPATSAQLAGPTRVAVDAADNFYFVDAFRIRKVAGGVITAVAGSGAMGFSGDGGVATAARFGEMGGIAVEAGGTLYVADSGNNRIRKVADGVVTTVAGGGTETGDGGAATGARLDNPQSVAVDAEGNLYVAEARSGRIRKVANGVITTVAGGGGEFGDGVAATSARLGVPTGVAVDGEGNLYIADSGRIRKVAGDVITTIAGGGTAFGDGGPATNAQLDVNYADVAVDAEGRVYFTDWLNSRVRVLTPEVVR